MSCSKFFRTKGGHSYLLGSTLYSADSIRMWHRAVDNLSYVVFQVSLLVMATKQKIIFPSRQTTWRIRHSRTYLIHRTSDCQQSNKFHPHRHRHTSLRGHHHSMTVATVHTPHLVSTTTVSHMISVCWLLVSVSLK